MTFSCSSRTSTLTINTSRPQHTMSFFRRMGSSASRKSSSSFMNASAPTRRPDAPPAYSPVDHTPQASTSHVEDDKYAFLSKFDTVFLIDDSGSMAGSRWGETSKALEAITPICTKYDADGIDIYFLNAKQQEYFFNVKSAQTVQRIFQQQRPGGQTLTGSRLNDILTPYLTRLESKLINNVKPLNIIVITDGDAQDDPESTIIAAAKKLEKLEAPAWQVGIQFFQVGNDAKATASLKALDDDLHEHGCPRDIVDTVPFAGGAPLSADGILKVVLGSVNRKLDRKSNAAADLRS